MRSITAQIWKAKDGWRWHMKRSGRIIAESGEGYKRPSGARKTLEHIINAIQAGAIKILPVVAAALLLLPGCATTGQPKPDPVAITITAIDTVVPIGVEYAAQQDPNCVPYLRAAVQVLNAAAANGNYRPVELLAALDASSTHELATPIARAAVMAGIGLYQGLLQAQVISNTQAVAIINALAGAIQSGIPPLAPSKAKRA